MKRRYTPPPTYGGSRFVRSSHGIRALEDGELDAEGRANTSRRNGGALPDFEYFTSGRTKTPQSSTEPQGSEVQLSEPRASGGPQPSDIPMTSESPKDLDSPHTADTQQASDTPPLPQSPHTPQSTIELSLGDGDLLLLTLLVLLASEDSCENVVATLAMLLMIR